MAEDTLKQARRWAALCHLSAVLMFATVPLGIAAGGNVLGPLFVWLAKGRDSPFVDDQGKESLNFQILMTLVGVALFLVPFARLLLQVVWAAFDMAFVFVASVKAYNGESYRYPMPVRLVR
jgi:uncharacterized Tic20 family protein